MGKNNLLTDINHHSFSDFDKGWINDRIDTSQNRSILINSYQGILKLNYCLDIGTHSFEENILIPNNDCILSFCRLNNQFSSLLAWSGIINKSSISIFDIVSNKKVSNIIKNNNKNSITTSLTTNEKMIISGNSNGSITLFDIRVPYSVCDINKNEIQYENNTNLFNPVLSTKLRENNLLSNNREQVCIYDIRFFNRFKSTKFPSLFKILTKPNQIISTEWCPFNRNSIWIGTVGGGLINQFDVTNSVNPHQSRKLKNNLLSIKGNSNLNSLFVLESGSKTMIETLRPQKEGNIKTNVSTYAMGISVCQENNALVVYGTDSLSIIEGSKNN